MAVRQEDLQPEAYYWARRAQEDTMRIVQISTAFGQEREFHTVAVIGSDQHYSLTDFEFVARVDAP